MAVASKKKSVASKKKKSSTSKKVKSISKKISKKRSEDINNHLVENFISLQKVMVNLSAKFDNLSSQITRLLEIFEISARSLAQKDFEKNNVDKNSGEILKKLDNLSQQAGLISKGLVLIHEANSKSQADLIDGDPRALETPVRSLPPRKPSLMQKNQTNQPITRSPPPKIQNQSVEPTNDIKKTQEVN